MKNTTRWFTVIAGLIATAPVAFASSDRFQPYMGVYGGMSRWENTQELSMMYGSDAPPAPVTLGPGNIWQMPSQRYSQNSSVGGVLLGASTHLAPRVVMGVEFNAGYNFGAKTIGKTDNDGENFHTIVQKLSPELGLAVLGGYQILPKFLGYAKLGYITSQFSSQSSEAGYDGPTGHFSQWAGGLLSGFGLGYTVTSKIDLRIEYQFIDYHTVTFVGENQSFHVKGQAQGPVTSKNNLSANRGLLVVTYKF